MQNIAVNSLIRGPKPARATIVRSVYTMQKTRTHSISHAISKDVAGQIIKQINTNSFSASQPCVKKIKKTVDLAVEEIWVSNAHVELQGSVGKGTGIAGESDLDFFVMLANTIPQVTRAHRKLLMDKIVSANDYIYIGRLGEHRIQLTPVHDNHLPSVDIVFERFKIVKPREEPNSNLSESHEAQLVTKFLKSLSLACPGPGSLLGGYTNLARPGYHLESFVILVEKELASKGIRQRDLTGAPGFALLLETCLEKIGKLSAMTANQQSCLEESGITIDDQWTYAARKCLNKLALVRL